MLRIRENTRPLRELPGAANSCSLMATTAGSAKCQGVMKIDVNQLLHFVAVANDLSFRKAADRLNLAQPWLSRQIGKLEAQLGFKLFIRTTRHVELTKKGERLLLRARMMAREVEATRSLATLLVREEPDKLRIGVPFFALYVRDRLRLFDAFHDKHPNIKLEICTGDQSQLRIDLMNGDLDGLFSTGPLDEAGLDIITLSERKLEVVLHGNDALLRKNAITLSDLAGRTAVVFPRHVNAGLYDELFGILEGLAGRMLEQTDFSYTSRLEDFNAISIVPGWSPHGLGNGMRRPIMDCQQMSRFQLLKRRTVQSEAMEDFWQTAKDAAAAPSLVRAA